MESHTMVGRVSALVLIVTLSIIGMPITAIASGDDDPVQSRRLTIHGQPLSEVLRAPATNSAMLTTDALDVGRLLRGAAELTIQGQADEQDEAESKPGWWSRRSTGQKVGIITAIALGVMFASVAICFHAGDCGG